MNIHEYQAKAILAQFGVAVPKGVMVESPSEVPAACKKIGGSLWVVKAQIHAGGRGKGGGVKLAKSVSEAQKYAREILGMTLVTPQTGEKGRLVSRLYIEEGSEIAEEFYLSLLVDRKNLCVSFIASAEGGMDIEEIAARTPEKVVTLPIAPEGKPSLEHAKRVCDIFGLGAGAVAHCEELLSGLHAAFVEKDMALLEINPLVLNKGGKLVCLDAKVSFDDNALYRHEDIVGLRDMAEEDPAEIEASGHGLSYIKLEGNIGCMVNGAGLAMASMDIIKLYGAAPANFLDVGGGASKEKVMHGFKIILSDKNVEGILVNIFGGIMRCDVIAEGILAAAKEMDIHVPLVVRLAGTKMEEGKKILAASSLNIIPAKDLDDAARSMLAAIKGVG